jgi:amidohydrolase
MAIINRIGEFHAELTEWRRDLHAHPEIAFEEERTSDFVAAKLDGFGLDEVHRGIAKTGVVGVLRNGSSDTVIGLRADMDALPIHEETGADHASKTPGKMHACGHDGHTTMLLGAARYLAETRNFDGTVVFIFQPAEENEGGGRVMLEEGLFERFPVERVFGMHNWPRMPLGQFAMRPGPVMAAADRFTIRLEGHGGHGAMPHVSRDPLVAAAQIVTALQTIVSRQVDPVESAVVTVTQIHGGDAYNVIPQSAFLTGTCRSFQPAIRTLLERQVKRISEGIGTSLGIRVEVDYELGYPPTVNSEAETEVAAAAAAEIAGEDKVDRAPPQVMGAEDFAFMLEQKPGSYIFIGNGGDEDSPMVHHPAYDFNDEALPFGASYWARLVERELPRAG